MTADTPVWDAPPWRLSGTVLVSLVNHRPFWTACGEAAQAPPYKAPPQAPVLAVMPRHTQVFGGRPIPIPQEGAGAGPDGAIGESPGVEVGVALGIVIGRPACRVSVHEALDCVAGYLVVGELSVPAPPGVAAHYRPGARWRARDGFCPLGAAFMPADRLTDADALRTTVEIDGRLVQAGDTGDRVRGVARLLADVSEFMTLRPGDVLTLGRSHGAPQARAGQRIRLSIDGVGAIEHPLVAETVHPRDGTWDQGAAR
jgi:5-oxopent-3-ene-1,2,5-tricarboxylate decarboxylase/2-hydroxyhepta-2,4-diene-1,7-dioate isomerase